MATISRIKAIMNFFEKDGGRKVTTLELKELNEEEKNELGRLCAQALGFDLSSDAPKA